MQINKVNDYQTQAIPAFTARPPKEIRKAVNAAVKEMTKTNYPVLDTFFRYTIPACFGINTYASIDMTLHASQFGPFAGMGAMCGALLTYGQHFFASHNLSYYAKELKAQGFKPDEIEHGLYKAMGKTGIPFISRAMANIFKRKQIAELAGILPKAANDNNAKALKLAA